MSFNIPKKLLEDVQDIIEQSAKEQKAKSDKLFKEGLKYFGAKDFNSLSESDQRALHSWVQNKLNTVNLGEETCADCDKEDCDCPVEEDCGPKEVEEEEKDLEDIKEEGMAGGVSISAHELASPEPSSAIGARQDVEMPKHADVIGDVDPLTGKEAGFRLLIQYPNSRAEFLPPTSLPAAPSLDALLDLAGALPGADILVAAIANAMDVPANQPQYQGNDKE